MKVSLAFKFRLLCLLDKKSCRPRQFVNMQVHREHDKKNRNLSCFFLNKKGLRGKNLGDFSGNGKEVIIVFSWIRARVVVLWWIDLLS